MLMGAKGRPPAGPVNHREHYGLKLIFRLKKSTFWMGNGGRAYAPFQRYHYRLVRKIFRDLLTDRCERKSFNNGDVTHGAFIGLCPVSFKPFQPGLGVSGGFAR